MVFSFLPLHLSFIIIVQAFKTCLDNFNNFLMFLVLLLLIHFQAKIITSVIIIKQLSFWPYHAQEPTMFFYNLSVVTLKILSNGTHFPSHNLFHVVFICSPLKPLLPSSLKWHLIDFRVKSKQLYMFWETLITGSFLSLKSLYPTLYFHILPEPCLTYLNSSGSSRSLSFLDLWSHSLKFSSPSF